MTQAKIDTLTACRWPGCANPGHRRDLCARDYSRVLAMVNEDGARWSDDPRVWATLWEDRTARVKAERRATAVRNLHGEGGEANSSLAEESKPAPRTERCAETSCNGGERCIKALVNGDAHEGLHQFVVGDTSQGLGGHRAVVDAAQARINAALAPQPTEADRSVDITELDGRARRAEAQLQMIANLTTRFSAPEQDVVGQVGAMVRHLANVETEGGRYGSLCQAAHDALSDGATSETLSDIREALGLPVDVDDSEIVRAVEDLVQAKRNAGARDADLALVRRVVGIQTAGLRTLADGSESFDIAVGLAADTIDAVCGVGRG